MTFHLVQKTVLRDGSVEEHLFLSFEDYAEAEQHFEYKVHEYNFLTGGLRYQTEVSDHRLTGCHNFRNGAKALITLREAVAMKSFNVAGDFESESDCLEWARGFVFSECETTEIERPKHSRYVTTVQGDVEVYYDIAGDYYFFAEKEDE